MTTPAEVGAMLIQKTQDGELRWVFYQQMYNLNHGPFVYRIENEATLFIDSTPFSSEAWVGDLVAAIKVKAIDADAVLASLGGK